MHPCLSLCLHPCLDPSFHLASCVLDVDAPAAAGKLVLIRSFPPEIIINSLVRVADIITGSDGAV